MKKAVSITVIALLIVAVFSGCGAKNPAVGTWQDENELVTFIFKNDGSGTLSVFVAMLNSATENDLEYTCEGDTIQWRFVGEGEYNTLTIEDGKMNYEGVILKKQ